MATHYTLLLVVMVCLNIFVRMCTETAIQINRTQKQLWDITCKRNLDKAIIHLASKLFPLLTLIKMLL